jgi:hypothetical protein
MLNWPEKQAEVSMKKLTMAALVVVGYAVGAAAYAASLPAAVFTKALRPGLKASAGVVHGVARTNCKGTDGGL